MLTPFMRAEQLAAAGLGTPADLARLRLSPKASDYALVFEDALVEQATEAYTKLWETRPAPKAKPHHTEVRLYAITVPQLREGGEVAEQFPGGLRQMAHLLRPGPLWMRFRFAEAGTDLGTVFDGLVYVDGHWAWFPKPWRVLSFESRPTHEPAPENEPQPDATAE